MENTLAIALIVGLVLFFMLIRFAVHALVNKAGDAVHNSAVRRREAANPPQTQRLADRYAAPVSTDRRS